MGGGEYVANKSIEFGVGKHIDQDNTGISLQNGGPGLPLKPEETQTLEAMRGSAVLSQLAHCSSE